MGAKEFVLSVLERGLDLSLMASPRLQDLLGSEFGETHIEDAWQAHWLRDEIVR